MAFRVLFLGFNPTNASEKRSTALFGPDESDDESYEGSAYEVRQAFDSLFSISDGHEAPTSKGKHPRTALQEPYLDQSEQKRTKTHV